MGWGDLRQMDQRKKTLMTIHKVLHPRDCMSQEKKEEEDSPALRITSMHYHKDKRIILKRAKKD